MTQTSVGDRTVDPRVALVTGASGTIGAEIAKALGMAGFRVAVHYHHGKESADQVVEHIIAAGGRATAVAAALSPEWGAAPLFNTIANKPRRAHYLVNK